MEKTRKVSAAVGLGDKTLKARFGVGEVATPLNDFEDV